MKKAKEMQKQMEAAQDQIRQTELKVEAAGGTVTYTFTGDGDPIDMQIHPDLLQDRAMLQSAVVAAIQEANKKRSALVQNLMQGMTAGLSLPGMPF